MGAARRASAALALALAVFVTPALASAHEVRVGLAPQLPAGTTPLAGIAAASPMRITVALAPRDPAALAAYARDVSTPGSPNYRHFLSVKRFARRFAPSAASLAAVQHSLRAHGLAPGAPYANHLTIPIDATAGLIERALNIVFERVRLPDGHTVVLATQAPSVDAKIAPAIQAVLGLDGQSHMHGAPLRATARSGSDVARSAASRKKTPYAVAPSPCVAATTAAAGQSAYTANQIAGAYRFSSLYSAGDGGQGVTIAVYELESDDPADIAAYEQCYGTSVPISYVGIDGGGGSGPGSGEAALDIEQLITLAPQAKLIVYQGPNSNSDAPGSGPYDTLATIVSDNVVQVVSNSWGECEALEGPTDARAENIMLEEAAAQGMTVVSAAGDSGSEDCDGLTATGAYQLGVDDPGSQPYVTDVGGTSLTALGPPPAEAVWNSGGGLASALGLTSGLGAGGGGISTLWPMPPYQSSAPASLGVVNGYSSGSPCAAAGGLCREVPDVSADADPAHGYLIYYNGSRGVAGSPAGWQATGGTSGASPLWAALFALADSSKGCAGVPIGFANPALYRLAAGAYATYFNDITSGNNDYSGTQHGKYPAAAGFDQATGLGSPDAAALVAGLCPYSLRIGVPAPGVGFVGTSVHIQVPVGDAPGVPVTFAASGLPSGVKLDSSTGLISGTLRAARANNVTVVASDPAGELRQVHFTWTVVGRPQVGSVLVRNPKSGPLTVQLTVRPGKLEPALRRVTVVLPGRQRLTMKVKTGVRKLQWTVRGGSAATLRRASRARKPTASVTIVDLGGATTSTTAAVRVVR